VSTIPRMLTVGLAAVLGVAAVPLSAAGGWGPKGRARTTSVEVNVPLADDRFEMPGAQSARPPEEIRQGTAPFTLDHNRMFVEVEFLRPDGTARKARAWVDTGSGTLTLVEPLARDLGLHFLGLRQGAADDSVHSSSPAPPIRLEGMPLDLTGIKVQVSSGTCLWPGLPAEATLPASVFRHDHVILDYPSLRITVARPGTVRPRGEAVPCRVNAETGLFAIAAVLNGETVQVGVDTGSAGTWVSDRITDDWLACHPDWPQSTGAAGSTNFFGFPFESRGTLTRLPELGIGTLRAQDVAVLGLPQGLFDWYSNKSACPVVGFIGANVLRGFRIEIDFVNGMTFWEAGRPPTPGDLDTVGLTLRPEADGAYTIAGAVTRDGNPAVEGVRPGDRLICVGHLDTSGATMGTVMDALRGNPGETRTLVIGRDGKRVDVEAVVARLP